MISLTCTNCKAVLKIDDGFAGGVCRCEHCGTIQTVPSHLKTARPASPGAAGAIKPKSAKTLYSKSGSSTATPARGEAIPSSGLDELAQIVASSGLDSGRLRARTLSTSGSARRKQILLIAAGAILMLVAGAVIAYLVLRGSAPPTQQTQIAQKSEPAVQEVHAAPSIETGATGGVDTQRSDPPAGELPGPNFCGLPLNARIVVYVLDRGSGTSDLFSYLKEATYRSALSLGSERKFQIIFWNNGSDDSFPSGGPTFASGPNVESARRALDGVFASGQTDITSALTQAVHSNPDAIVIATGKGWQLDDGFVDQVMSIRADRPIKINCLSLGGNEPSPVLKTIAQRSGGESRLITEAELKQAARD